jgi:hypothetical protein
MESWGVLLFFAPSVCHSFFERAELIKRLKIPQTGRDALLQEEGTLQMPYREFRRKLSASYLDPFILAVGVLTALVLWRIQTQISTVDWVEHSDEVIT